MVASDREANDEFGAAVAISGDYAISGAFVNSKDTNGIDSLSGAGAAYIFERNGLGNWLQKQKIVASDREAGNAFGYAVSISGNYAIVGALGNSKDTIGLDSLSGSGAAYIFERNASGNWVQKQKIVASDRASGDMFGVAVAISGNYAIVGAYQNTKDTLGADSLYQAGASYIFEPNGSGIWKQKNKIVASDRETGDFFGYTVSISGNYAVIGAYKEDKDANGLNTLNTAGSAYIFERDALGNWNQQQKIVAVDRTANDAFGQSVSISGNYLIVGADLQGTDANNANFKTRAGAAYIFKRSGLDKWTQVQKIAAADRDLYTFFGGAVSISGNHIVVGAIQESRDVNDLNILNSAGAAYIFECPPCTAPTTPTLSLVWDTICKGVIDTIKIASTDSLHSATQWFLYAGSCGGIAIDSNAIGTFKVSPNQTTTYYIRAEGGCTVPASCTTNSITVTVLSPIIFLGNDTSLCQNQTLQLNATTANATAYLWQDNSTASTYTVTAQGTYWAQATTVCGNVRDSIRVNYIAPLTLNLGNDTTLCPNQTLILNATNTNAVYLWQNNSTTSTYTVTAQGSYSVQVSNRCETKHDSIKVSYILPLTLNLGNDTTLCQSQTLLLNATNTNSNYLWQNNSTASTFTVTAQGTYSVQVSNSCETKHDSIKVSYLTPLTVNLGNDTTLCPNQTLILNATNINATYLWQNNSTDPVYTVTTNGTYWVEVTNTCNSKRDSITVKEINCDTTSSTSSVSVLEMPNVFSPNNDGVNELFIPQKTKEITNTKIAIYNKWGEKLYESSSLLEGWDGRTKAGIAVPEGTYYWIIDYADNKGQQHHLKGFVMLVR